MKWWHLGLGLLGWQALVYLGDKDQRWRSYHYAESRAKALGKGLLVVGGPYPSSHNSEFYRITGSIAHGYGDMCVDIAPEACTGAQRMTVADVRALPFRDRGYGVSYCGHLLEMLPSVGDVKRALGELYRVADEVVIDPRTKWLVLNWLSPNGLAGVERWVYQTGPRTVNIEERDGRLEVWQA